MIKKRFFIEKYVENVVVNWDNITKTHNLKINFKLPPIKDRGKEIGNNN